MSPVEDTGGGTADPVREAIAFGTEVQDELAAAEQVEEGLLERVAQARKQASQAGEYAWGFADREGLDLIVRRASRALRRAGLRPDPDFGRVQPFEARNPSFEKTTRERFLELVEEGKPIIGRRFAPDDGGQTLPDLTGAVILDCAFVGWGFDEARLEGARIVHTIFEDCSFDGARMAGAVASTCLFKCSEQDETVAFRVDAPQANFSGSYLAACDVRGANLRRSAFSYAYLQDVLADEDTDLRGATFDLASLEGFAVARSDLRGAAFCGATLVRADFRDAELKDAVFSSAKIAGARFEGAKLENTAFRTAYYVGLAHFDTSVEDADMLEDDLKAVLQAAEDGTSDRAEVELDDEGAEADSER